MKGQILNSKELAELFEGLKLNGIHHYSHLLTGINNIHFFVFENFTLHSQGEINLAVLNCSLVAKTANLRASWFNPSQEIEF